MRPLKGYQARLLEVGTGEEIAGILWDMPHGWNIDRVNDANITWLKPTARQTFAPRKGSFDGAKCCDLLPRRGDAPGKRGMGLDMQTAPMLLGRVHCSDVEWLCGGVERTKCHPSGEIGSQFL
jgi:hypothetical protein